MAKCIRSLKDGNALLQGAHRCDPLPHTHRHASTSRLSLSIHTHRLFIYRLLEIHCNFKQLMFLVILHIYIIPFFLFKGKFRVNTYIYAAKEVKSDKDKAVSTINSSNLQVLQNVVFRN